MRGTHPGRRQEDRLREHLSAVLEATSDLVFTATPDGRFLYFNRSARRRLGLPNDCDLTTLRPSDLHPAWALRLIEKEGLPAAARDDIWRGETAVLDRDGREIPVSQVVLAHRDPKGEVRYFSTILRDISDIRRLEGFLERRIEARTAELAAANAALQEEVERRSVAQEELRRQIEILATIADNSPAILVLADPSGRLEFVSKAFERLTGWSPLDVTRPDLVAACYPDPDVRCAAEECMARADPGWREFPMATRDGRQLRISWANVKLTDGSQVGIGVDVTGSRQAQEELEALNTELEQRNARLQAMALEVTQAQEAERRSLAQLLHDNLQQLLTGARFSLHASSSRAAGVPELADNLDRIEQLMEEAIRVSRSLTLNLAPPALYESGLAAGLDSLARQTRETHGLDVHVEVGGGAEPESESVRVFLYQAVRELLFNITKHARATRASVRLLPTGDELVLTVEDDGVGFDPPQIASGGKGESAGFGLFSIRERIVPLGGALEIESAPGRGSRFTLRTPLGGKAAAPAVGAPAFPPSTPATPKPRDSRHPRVRVLLADDHRVMRQGLASLLEQQPDIEIVGEADNGREAVELAHALVPDVVVMDVNMPEMNGLEATARIARELPAVRVVALSIQARQDMEASMLAAGASAYLSKAGPSEALLAAIRGRPATESA